MKRNIPGGRVESVFSPSKDGKEVIATKVLAEEDADVEVVEDDLTDDDEVSEESK